MATKSFDARFDSLQAGVNEVNGRLGDLSKNLTYLMDSFHSATHAFGSYSNSVEKSIGEIDSKITLRFNELDKRLGDRDTENTTRSAELRDRIGKHELIVMEKLQKLESLVLQLRVPVA
jgi:tetrahydromethanopterin S-methyltransferase subunit G